MVLGSPVKFLRLDKISFTPADVSELAWVPRIVLPRFHETTAFHQNVGIVARMRTPADRVDDEEFFAWPEFAVRRLGDKIEQQIVNDRVVRNAKAGAAPVEP